MVVRRALIVSLVTLIALFGGVGSAAGAAPDPLKSGLWGQDFRGTYRFHDMTLAWMQAAVNRANATIGHIDARNPDFEASTGTTNGDVHYWPASQNDCDGSLTWIGCADAFSSLTYRLWLSSGRCWTDGTNLTCAGTQYDVETVALNEMGHVNRLSHHLPEAPHGSNPNYSDAVVQAYPDPFGHVFGTNRAIRWADHQALHALYP